MITVSGHSYVLGQINGEDIPDAVQLISVCIRSHYKLKVPTVALVVVDLSGWLKNRLADSAQLNLLVSQRKENNAAWMPFRVFSFRPIPNPTQGMVTAIYGYWDYKSYLYSYVSRDFTGPSSSVVTTLAGEGNLTPVVDQTTEQNHWYVANKRLSDYVNGELVPMSQRSANSYMVSLIDARNGGTWYYKDLNQVVANNTLNSRLTNTSGVQLGQYDAFFSEYSYDNGSGFLNQAAYSMKNAVYSATNGQYAEDTPIQASRTNMRLSVSNQDIPDRSLVVHQPLDFGNNGAGPMNRGFNLRQASLWSSRMDILLNEFSNFPMLTMHQIDVVNGPQGKDERQTGRYIAVGRIIGATKDTYKERICFVRNSESITDPSLY